MKKLLPAFIVPMVTLAQGAYAHEINGTEHELTITVTNPSSYQRAELAQTEAGIFRQRFPDGFILKNSYGEEIPYQLTYDGKFVFPVILESEGKQQFKIASGKPNEVTPKVYGRHFPEHKDNFSWENDKGAYTAYGPALQAAGERGFGYDIWTKSVDTLVLEDRYRLDAEGLSMHTDNGNGMDAYIVASSLGGGASALLDDNGDIVFPWAWQKHEVLDNGPLRITVKLIYGPSVVVADSNVVETRIISLDAGSWLNRTEVCYDGLTVPRKVVAGPVVHTQNPDGYTLGEGYVAYVDFTEDKDADNGLIYIGALMPEKAEKTRFIPIKDSTRDATGHALVETSYIPGEKLVYYWGSAWSKGDHPSDWDTYFQLTKDRLVTPLKVTVTK